MKNILIINRKGGVGKTLVSDELAFALDAKNVPYCFYDLDGQGGMNLLKWMMLMYQLLIHRVHYKVKWVNGSKMRM